MTSLDPVSVSRPAWPLVQTLVLACESSIALHCSSRVGEPLHVDEFKVVNDRSAGDGFHLSMQMEFMPWTCNT